MNYFEEQIRYDTKNMTIEAKKQYLREHENDFGFEKGELDYLLFEKGEEMKDIDVLKNNVKNNLKLNKWIELKVIQGFYEGKWEDLTFYDINDKKEMADFKENLKSYRENENTSFRSINRKVINPEWFDKIYPNLVMQGNRNYYEINQFEVKSDKRLNEIINELQNYNKFLKEKEM